MHPSQALHETVFGWQRHTYKLKISLQAAHDQPRRPRRHQIPPLLPMGRVDMDGEVGDPVYARRLGKAVVIDVVDMALMNPNPQPGCAESATLILRVTSTEGARERQKQHTKVSISPHAISLASSPRRPPVRNPSLPASSSLHSVASAPSTAAARETCARSQPKMMHLPTRARSSSIHRDGGGGGDDRGG